MTQELGPHQTAWLEALESGKYKQGTAVLRSPSDKFCCLVVACIIAGIGFDDDDYLAPWALVEHLALFDDNAPPRGVVGFHIDSLAGLNDSGKSFSEIVALVRQDPSIYFKEPR